MLEMLERELQDNVFKEYKELFLDLKKEEYFGRLGKTFKTDQNYYFIDTGTGKIAKVKENVYLVLKSLFENDNFESLSKLNIKKDDLLEALEQIKTGVKNEYILSAPLLETMGENIVTDIDEALLNHVRGFNLEVTEECNLRCKYCIYHPSHPSFREFGKKHMSLETAKQAIDFLKNHSSKNNDFTAVGFYGGEPLMNFEVVKGAISYSQEIFSDRNLQFNLTTNAVLLTESICDYLVENKVILTLSLDGPKEVHDENRVFSNNKGSFDSVIKGIRNLLQSFKKFDRKPDFAINMVNTGPDFKKQYDLIQEFFEEYNWLPEGIDIICNGLDTGPKRMDYALPQSKEERLQTEGLAEVLGAWNDTKHNDYMEKEKTFSERSINQELVKIHKRTVTKKPEAHYSMNGCCIPGQKRGYVDVNGNIFPCERVGNNIPPLGNVKTGWDISKVKKYYVDDYIKKSKKFCKNCWAVNMCGLCYTNCYHEEGIEMPYKHALCLGERVRIESYLVRYHKILENNPDIIKAIDEIEFVV